MNGPRFDATINLGHLISLGAVVCAIIGTWYLTDHRLTTLERQVQLLPAQLSTIVVETARFDERLKDFARRIDRLERR
jgi:hypothetical protein